ncbi:hypothetical protein CEXT_178381 [Caerostris extrusa]|uniref:Uncharacterized protein n=1 Tax=Caerostris extrusa TaxID=172846 RepID=A0AAV4QL23_CAEEX|nr:hypothetical protein CEXT_178381 [Caerostris extrusa]
MLGNVRKRRMFVRCSIYGDRSGISLTMFENALRVCLKESLNMDMLFLCDLLNISMAHVSHFEGVILRRRKHRAPPARQWLQVLRAHGHGASRPEAVPVRVPPVLVASGRQSRPSPRRRGSSSHPGLFPSTLTS